MAGRWVAIDAPLDSSGTSRGEQAAPRALRAGGLLEAVGARDGGQVEIAITDRARDAGCGVIALGQLQEATARIRKATAQLLEAGDRPLLIGGDCTILIGAIAALADHHPDIALAFIDGHADFLPGDASPTGEAADMDLAALTGHGPPQLLPAGARRPLVEPGRVYLLGHRPSDSSAEADDENARVPAAIEQLDARTILREGPRAVGERVASRLSAAAPALWLHLDLDVLDPSALPAVSYPQDGGLSWEALEALVRPIAASENLRGLSVADFNPTKDPDGRAARRVVAFLALLLVAGGAGSAPPR